MRDAEERGSSITFKGNSLRGMYVTNTTPICYEFIRSLMRINSSTSRSKTWRFKLNPFDCEGKHI